MRFMKDHVGCRGKGGQEGELKLEDELGSYSVIYVREDGDLSAGVVRWS